MGRELDDIAADLDFQKARLRSGMPQPTGHGPPELSMQAGSLEVQLGNTVAVRKNGGRVALLRARGDSKFGRVFTINAQASNFQGGLPGAVGRRGIVRMTVEWGQGGGNYVAQFDAREGAQISVLGASVQVYAEIVIEDPAAQSSVIDSATVTASISEGTRAAKAEPTYSYDARILGVGAVLAEDIPIPPFARTFMVGSPRTPDPFALGAMAVQFIGYAGDATPFVFAAYTGTELLQAMLNGDGLRWPDAARFVHLTNLTAADFIVVPFFELSL
jgi:hypothetical protein